MSSFIAVRLADRYFDTRNPESIGQSGNLRHFVVLSGIICSVAAMAIIYMGHNQRLHRFVIHDVDVAFELSCAPPEPSFRTGDQLVPLKFDEGQKPAPLANTENEIHKSTTELEKATAKKLTDKVEQSKVRQNNNNNNLEAPIAVGRIDAANRPVANVLVDPFGGAAANAATPVADTSPAGGALDGKAGAVGPGHGSGSGQSNGDTSSLTGSDFGANQLIAMRAPPTAMGNIGPYKRDLVARIKAAWHPVEAYDQVEVQVTLSREGKLLSSQLLRSTGNSKIDSTLLEAIDSTDFAALPEWFQGHQLKIRLILKSS